MEKVLGHVCLVSTAWTARTLAIQSIARPRTMTENFANLARSTTARLELIEMLQPTLADRNRTVTFVRQVSIVITVLSGLTVFKTALKVITAHQEPQI